MGILVETAMQSETDSGASKSEAEPGTEPNLTTQPEQDNGIEPDLTTLPEQDTGTEQCFTTEPDQDIGIEQRLPTQPEQDTGIEQRLTTQPDQDTGMEQRLTTQPEQDTGIEQRLTTQPDQDTGMEQRLTTQPEQDTGIEQRLTTQPEQDTGIEQRLTTQPERDIGQELRSTIQLGQFTRIEQQPEKDTGIGRRLLRRMPDVAQEPEHGGTGLQMFLSRIRTGTEAPCTIEVTDTTTEDMPEKDTTDEQDSSNQPNQPTEQQNLVASDILGWMSRQRRTSLMGAALEIPVAKLSAHWSKLKEDTPGYVRERKTSIVDTGGLLKRRLTCSLRKTAVKVMASLPTRTVRIVRRKVRETRERAVEFTGLSNHVLEKAQQEGLLLERKGGEKIDQMERNRQVKIIRHMSVPLNGKRKLRFGSIRVLMKRERLQYWAIYLGHEQNISPRIHPI